MRVLLMSDIRSEHTEKWALSLAESGIEVGIFSFNNAPYSWYEGKKGVQVLFQADNPITGSGLGEKLSYFKYLPVLKKKIKEFKPDILHAHYATSYGLIGAISGFKPFVVSVWGSDVYDFPKQGKLNTFILKYVLKKATHLTSTSYCMKDETLNYTDKVIDVVPFGIDITKFNRKEPVVFENNKAIIIGNIKPLETKYGISILILAFEKVIKAFPKQEFKLLLIGEGSKRIIYEQLAEERRLGDKVTFTGRISFDEIAEYHRKIDIFVCLSILDSESFGVSVVEAMASKSLIVASKVAGFNEVMGGNNSCGLMVNKESVDEAANAIISIINDPASASIRAENARNRACDLYNWDNNVKQMIDVYQKILQEK